MKVSNFNISVAQNQITNPIQALAQKTSNNVATSSQGTSHKDEVNIMLQTSIGGADYDYTKEDAIQSAWQKENELNLYDILSGKTKTGDIKLLGNTPPSAGFIAKLEQEGISNEANWYLTDKEFDSLSSSDLKESVDYLASKYAVLKDGLTANFTGEELDTQLKKLDETFTAHKERLATEFSDTVGGLFEESGLLGEKDKIYQSISKGFDEKIKEYDSFIKNNRDFAGIEGTKDEWLKNDASYMASELRKAQTSQEATSKNSDLYSIEDLDVVFDVVSESMRYISDESDKIGIGGSEQKAGLKLADLTLKTRVFAENSIVAGDLKEAILKSTDYIVDKAIDDLDKQYEDYRENPLAPEDVLGFAPLNKEDIYEVIDKVMDTYNQTGSTSKALKEGAAFAISEFNKLRNDDGDVYRYKGNNFRDFYEVGESKDSVISIKFPDDYKEKSDLEKIQASFNSFVSDFNLGNNNLIKLSEFSVYV